MALQVWLPLNGSLTNQGVDNPNVISRGLTYSSTSQGKVAPQAAKFSGDCNQYIHVGNTGDYQYENFTWSCWIYPTQHTGAEHIISNGRDYDKFGMSLTTSNGALRVQTDSVYLDICSLSVNTWYHVAITKNGTKLSCYVNGALTKSATISTPDYTYSEGLTIGKMSYNFQGTTAYFPFYGLIQDVRIYDNALSDREVKELSKGMVCHYTLSDINATTSVNKYSGETVLGKANSTDFSMSKNADGEGYKYTLNYTGTGSNKWFSIGFPTASFEVGKTYDYSCKIRCNSANFVLQMRASRCGNDWATNMVNVSNADGKWHEYHLKQKMTGTTFERSSSTDVQKTAPLVEFYTGSLATNGTVYKCDFDIKDVQFSECSEDAPISNASWNDGILYDSSGNGNHLSISGKTKYETNSQRFDGCINFNQTGYFKKDNLNIYFEAFTIAFWVKVPNSIAAQHFLFGTFISWTAEGVGAWRDGSGQTGYACIMRSDAESNYGSFWGNSSLIPTFDKWTHVAYVYNGTQIKTYRDGALMTTTTYGKRGKCYMPNLYLGNSKFSNTPSSETDQSSMSDFRLYATALSDADIKELYETPVSLTNTGTLMTQGEYKEI